MAGVAFPAHFSVSCQVTLCPGPLGSQLAGITDLSVGPGELGLGWVMTSLPLTCSFRWGAGSHSIQMANCFVPVSANHSDSLSLLKTHSLFKDLMVSKINLASSVIPLPFCTVPSPNTLPYPGMEPSAPESPLSPCRAEWRGAGSTDPFPGPPEHLRSVAFWGKKSQEGRAGVNGTLISHHPACFWLPRAGLKNSKKLPFANIICVLHLSDMASFVCFGQLIKSL